MKSKYIIILLLSVLIISSCRSKIFKGTDSLPCGNYQKMKKDKNWIGLNKKGKSRLFKKSKY